MARTKTAKTNARKTANRVRETAPIYTGRKTRARAVPELTVPAAPKKPQSAWTAAFANAKAAVANDAAQPVMQSTTKKVGIAAALVGLGIGAHALLAR